MSKRVEEILEVVEEVRDNFRLRTSEQHITALRIQAVNSVAVRRGIAPQTVRDTFRRQLMPEVDGVEDFDALLDSWLVGDSHDLAKVIETHASDQADVELIGGVFERVSDEDRLLAEEFGYDAGSKYFREGKAQLKVHLTRERRPQLVARAKQKWNNESGGQPLCLICGFSFSDTYGSVGDGFIEAHHIIPISELASDTLIGIDDLAPVCSNCHSILHRYRPWPSVNDLAALVLTQ